MVLPEGDSIHANFIYLQFLNENIVTINYFEPCLVWLSWSEVIAYIERLQVRFPVRDTHRMRFDPQSGQVLEGNQLMFLSHINVSLSNSVSLLFPLSL